MPQDGPKPRQSVRAWDLPTRAFHWTLVTLVLVSWFTYQFSEAIGDHRLRWHRNSGYAVLILVTWRLLWGMMGSSTARFSSFVRGPGAVLSYLSELSRGKSRHYLGHNPAGALMVLLLLTLLLVQTGLGLFTVEHNDLVAGPLYRLVEEATQKQLSRLHRINFYWVLLPAIGLHVLANILYGVIKKDPLIRAMVTGWKPAGDYADEVEADVPAQPLLRAVGLFAAAAVLVIGPLWMFGGRL
jgi:cytochrome b